MRVRGASGVSGLVPGRWSVQISAKDFRKSDLTSPPSGSTYHFRGVRCKQYESIPWFATTAPARAPQKPTRVPSGRLRDLYGSVVYFWRTRMRPRRRGSRGTRTGVVSAPSAIMPCSRGRSIFPQDTDRRCEFRNSKNLCPLFRGESHGQF